MYTMKTGKPGVSLGCRGDRATGALQFVGEVRVTMTIDALLKSLDGMETVGRKTASDIRIIQFVYTKTSSNAQNY